MDDLILRLGEAVEKAKLATKLKNLQVSEGSFCDEPANELAKVVFFKRDQEVNMISKAGDIPLGMSEKEWIWHSEIMPAVSEFQEAYGKEQHDKEIAAGMSRFTDKDPYKHMSREQLQSEFFKTPKGKRLYEKYAAASAETTSQPVAKVDDRPRNLREYADCALDAIAKQYQTNGITIEAAHRDASKKSAEYAAIYTAGYDNILGTLDFSNSVSKSKTDAMGVWRAEIDRLASKAGA